MGQASRKLAHRLRHSRRGTQGWRQQGQHDAVRIPKDVKNIHHLVEHEGYDPLHAAYIAAQNLLSFFAESVSTFDEFAAYCDIVGAAEDAYMPGGPRSARSRSAILPRGHCSTCALALIRKRSAPVYSMWPNSSVSTPSPWTRCRTSRGPTWGCTNMSAGSPRGCDYGNWSRAMCSSAMSLRATWERQANSGTSVVAHPARSLQLPHHLHDAVCTHRDQQSGLDSLPQQVDPGNRPYRPAYGTL